MKPDSDRQRGGFSYRVTVEQIRRWRTLPPAVRLQWLEDANRLLWQALSPHTKAIRDKFRRGQI